jgi:elongation factor G
MTGKAPSGPRCAAIAGPYLSGKTSLLEALLYTCEAIPRLGTIKDGNTVGDSSDDARARQMSTELNIASATFLDEEWTFVDCPGSVEFIQESRAALMAADVAIVVCEPETSKALMLAPVMQFLDAHDIPRMLFINKVDHSSETVRDLLAALQDVSSKPLVLRQVPIRDGDAVTGYVDLVSERAYEYEPGTASKLIEVPESVSDRNEEARQEMLESLADFDDDLLEQLLEDNVPPSEKVYALLGADLQNDLITPVFLGAAERDHGVLRLMKALRHEAPEVIQTLERHGGADGDTVVQVFKTYHMLHAGKMSVGRVWKGEIKDGMSFGNHRVSGMNLLKGHEAKRITSAIAGSVVAMGSMDDVHTGHTLSEAGATDSMDWPETPAPIFSMVAIPDKRDDEVKLSTGIARLMEEDPSISMSHNDDTNQNVLWGQGEIQLQVLGQRLKNRFNTAVTMHRPRTPYKETIKKAIQQHARHKKQSGGHGEFGDVHLDIKPQPRGSGFEFSQSISGGVVPRQYIPAVEAGVKEYCTEGPLGFPVVDLSVNLFDGQHHAVDSSDMAFRRAGILAMKDALPNCSPVLLEPICNVNIAIPNQYTSNAQSIITKRRGQILSFQAKDGWTGWDEVQANIPQSELHDLAIDLRSQTMGIGSFEWSFDHMAELAGRAADDVIEQHKAAAE